MEEEKANANSELRYLALELMKVAKRDKKSFKKVASEYVHNVFDLEKILKKSSRVGSKANYLQKNKMGFSQKDKKDRD